MDTIKGDFILVLSQRDIKHPKAGGAEKYLHNALIDLAKEHQVVHFAAGFQGGADEEIIDNIRYIRDGNNLLSVITRGMSFYRKYKAQVQLVIDHSNTHQFFTFLWARKKRVFFIHQMAIECWEYYYGKKGKLFRWLEEILIRLSKGTTITVSPSTKQDLVNRGFKDVYVCAEGNDIILNELPSSEIKEDYLTYVGRLVPYKKVEDVIMLGKVLQMPVKIIGRGSDDYTNKLKRLVDKYKVDCEFTGFVSKEEKIDIVKKAKYNVLPSIREGWGLVITEAANLGTPSIVYNVNGVVDAVNQGRAGFIASQQNFHSLENIVRKTTSTEYNYVREKAFEYSLEFTWEETSKQFQQAINTILEKRS